MFKTGQHLTAIQKQTRRQRCLRNKGRIMAINIFCVALCVGVTQEWQPSHREQPSHDKYLHFIDQVTFPWPTELTVKDKSRLIFMHIKLTAPLTWAHPTPPHPPTRNPTHLRPSYKYCLIIQYCILPLNPRPPNPPSPSQPHVRHGGKGLQWRIAG